MYHNIAIAINSILALLGLGCLWAGIWGIKALEEMGEYEDRDGKED